MGYCPAPMPCRWPFPLIPRNYVHHRAAVCESVSGAHIIHLTAGPVRISLKLVCFPSGPFKIQGHRAELVVTMDVLLTPTPLVSCIDRSFTLSKKDGPAVAAWPPYIAR